VYYKLKRHDGQRFVGDVENMIVHDTWHPDSEDCMVEEIVRRGAAVAFEPDDLDQAFWDGFDYCEHCFDKSDPAPPVRDAAVTARQRG